MVGALDASNRSKGAGQLMMALVLIALVAGAASALMFASIVSGALISLLLVCLAPMPLMVASLAWGPLCGTIGGIFAILSLAATFGMPTAIGFAVADALPAWWLGHLVLLGRPVTGALPQADGAPDLEWYPIGRVLVWIAAIAALITMASLLSIGTDAATISDTLRRSFVRTLRAVTGSEISDTDAGVHVFVAVVPVVVAMSCVTTLAFNLWLAAKVAATSGRLRRPWPDLTTTALPPMTLVALCVALAACFGGGLIGMFAEAVAAALLTAYALTGFAVLHTLTFALKSRALWLGAAYAAVVILFWPLIAMVILGLADAVFGFRKRFPRNRPPPLPTP
jgi:hypothetical protein